MLDPYPAIQSAYFDVVGDPIQARGLPTSDVVDQGNHYALRAQRVVLQQWKEDMPWAKKGEVTVALGGDFAKEAGVLPTLALAPVDQDAVAKSSPYGTPVCQPSEPDGRLLFMASNSSYTEHGIWSVSPAGGEPRLVLSTGRYFAFFVATSPDGGWATYYQLTDDRRPDGTIVADTWVLNLLTDEATRLVPRRSPLGWTDDNVGVVLRRNNAGEPWTMAKVPSGELVRLDDPAKDWDRLAQARISANGRYRAVVSLDRPNGPRYIGVTDLSNNATVLKSYPGSAPIASIDLTWSPDSKRLAYRAAYDEQGKLHWRLRVLDISTGAAIPVSGIGHLEIGTPLWVSRLSTCG